MNHYSDDLKAFIDGELGTVRALFLRRHLARCAACREEKTQMENLGKELQAANAGEEMPATLRAKLLDGAPTANVANPPRSSGIARGYRPSWKDGLLVGALGVMLFAVSTAGRQPKTVFGVANNSLTTSTSGENESVAMSSEQREIGGPVNAPMAGNAGAARAKNEDYKSADGDAKLERRSAAMLDKAEAQAPAAAVQKKMKIAQRIDGNEQSGAKTSDNSAPLSISGLPNDASDAVDAALESRRVHKVGSISVEVDDIEKNTAQVVAAVQSIGGFVAGNTLSTGTSGRKTANLQVRVPVEKFESVLQQIGELGEVKAKNISGQDVTDKWANAQTRSAILNQDLTLRETQLQAALKRAKDKKRPGDIPWQMRSEVRELRIQAAQSRARLNLLRRLSELSNISIQLQEKVVIPGTGGFLENVGQTWNDAGTTFAAAARVPVNCLIWILAYSPLWLPLLLAWKFLSRTQSRKTG